VPAVRCIAGVKPTASIRRRRRRRAPNPPSAAPPRHALPPPPAKRAPTAGAAGAAPAVGQNGHHAERGGPTPRRDAAPGHRPRNVLCWRPAEPRAGRTGCRQRTLQGSYPPAGDNCRPQEAAAAGRPVLESARPTAPPSGPAAAAADVPRDAVNGPAAAGARSAAAAGVPASAAAAAPLPPPPVATAA
jgi:hypothetical protein